MVESIINCAAPEDADAVLIGVPYGHGASFGQGAAHGPAAIVACLDRQIDHPRRIEPQRQVLPGIGRACVGAFLRPGRAAEGGKPEATDQTTTGECSSS